MKKDRGYRRICLVAFLSFYFTTAVFSQSASNYTFSTATNGNFTSTMYGHAIDLSTVPILVTNNTVDLNTFVFSIGFDFYFMDRIYTHFTAGVDGEVALGTSVMNEYILTNTGINDLTRTISYPPIQPNSSPILTAFWDDLRTSRQGNTIRSKLVGTSPNRCRVIEWNTNINTSSSTNSTSADGQFQVRIYETGEIEYVYGKMQIGPSSGVVTASIGFTAGANDNQFIAIDDLSAYTTTTVAANEPATQLLVNSSTTGAITALNSTVEGSRRCFRFIPPSIIGNFSGLNISDIGATGMRLTWTDNFSNEDGFAIFSSSDNVNFVYVSSAPANATTVDVTGLNPATTYYWRVCAFTEGNPGNAITASASTTTCDISGYSGTKTVGPSGEFASLTEAFNSLRRNGIKDSVLLELKAGYTSVAEVFPIVLGKLKCPNSPKIIVRPEAGAANLVISGSSPSSILLFENSSLITIDGRPGGTGSTSELTISNTDTLGVTIRIVDSATNIGLDYLTIRGTTVDESEAVVNIQVTNATHNIRIDHCDIASGATPASNLICALAIPSATGPHNITITNSKLHDFYHPQFRSSAINIGGDVEGCTISDNDIYQTVERTYSNQPYVYGIYLTSVFGRHYVSNNRIGGSAPGNAGAPMTLKGNFLFRAIYSNAGIGRPNTIIGNRISNISLVDGPPIGFHAGIHSTTSGIIYGNVITGAGGTPGISMFNSANYSQFLAGIYIENTSTDTLRISNNRIGGLRADGVPGALVNVFGIYYPVNKACNIDSNIVGGDTVQALINTTGGKTVGIHLPSIYGNSGIVKVRYNTISYLTGTNIATSAIVTGIQVYAETGGNFTITSNEISHLHSASTSTASNASAALTGIILNAQSAVTQNITKNKIHSLMSTATGTPVVVTGIYQSNSVLTPNTTNIQLNKISHLNAVSTNNVTLNGIVLNNSTGLVDNNMIQLGIDSAGNSISNSYTIYGISHLGGTYDIDNNSIYIGGSNVVDSNRNTYAFSSTALSSSSRFYNNVFVNQRSNALSGGHHYCMGLGTSTVDPNKNILLNANIYFAINNGGYVGRMYSMDLMSISLWKAGYGGDANSGHANPNFKNPGGSALNFDLHVDSITPVERFSTGNTTLTDIDGETRSSLTPVDNGADAGNFIKSDAVEPVFTYTPLVNISDSLPRSIIVNIKDPSPGVDTGIGKKPRIWFRRSYPSVSPWVSSEGQFVNGSSRNGDWRFTLGYSIAGISPVVGDSIQYYFVAQDSIAYPNTGTSPSQSLHRDVNTQVLAPLVPLAYLYTSPWPDSVLVGSGQSITSLTGSTGLFAALNKLFLSHDVVAMIKTDLLEDGTYSLDSNVLAGYRLRIVPSGDTVKLVRNSAALANAMIRFNGTKKVTFDGSYNGAGRYIRLVNTNPTSNNCKPVLAADYGCDSIVYKNLIVESNVTSIFLADLKGSFLSATPNNRNIIFKNNLFRDALAGTGITAGKPIVAIGSNGTGNKLIITGNEIINFSQYGIYAKVSGDSCRIDSNHFYYSYPGTVQGNQLVSIDILSGKYHTISNNQIGGSEPYCGGLPWHNSSTVNSFYGIVCFASSVTISENVIRNILLPANSSSIIMGIYNKGAGNVITKNMIGDSVVANSLSTGSSSVTGIENGGSSATISDNIIANLTSTNTTGSSAFFTGISSVESGSIITGNSVYNLQTTGASGGIRMTGISVSNGSYHSVDRNLVHDLYVHNTANSSTVYGLNLATFATASANRNRIFNLSNRSASGGSIYGIRVCPGSWDLINNQISITNSSNNNSDTIGGIYDITNAWLGVQKRFYNSVYIGGSSSTSSNSFAYRKEYNAIQVGAFKNNLFYNERSGPGNHVIMSIPQSNPGTIWSPGISNHNLFVGTDSLKIAEWGPANYLSMAQWRSATAGDASSFAALNAFVPKDSLFINTGNGNLNIDTANRMCWYVNGKGLPINGISADYDSAGSVRSETIATGATDIGSDEFNTTTLPDTLIVLGRHMPGNIDSLMLNGRVVAIITWGNTGTLPTLGSARYYSGTWPNDITNGADASNARPMNAWLDIPVTGGSDYTYSITLFYDSSMLGKVQDVSQIVLHKKISGEDGTWQILLPTQINASAKTITVNGLASFSEFTGAQSDTPLAVPGSSICADGATSYKTNIAGTGYTYLWQVNAGNDFVNITNDAIYNGVTDSVLTITAPTSTFNRYQYRCVVNTGSGMINSNTFLLKITNTWTGAINADWTNPQNWSCGQVPDANTDVHIKSGLLNYPVITTNITCRSIIVSPRSVIQVNPGVGVQLTGK